MTLLITPNNCFEFQDDNASCHRSAVVKKWIRDHQIHQLWWPANSPDMNPIENLWGILVKKLSTKVFENKEELVENILRIWNEEITVEICSNLAHSMVDRIQELKRAKGLHTKY